VKRNKGFDCEIETKKGMKFSRNLGKNWVFNLPK